MYLVLVNDLLSSQSVFVLLRVMIISLLLIAFVLLWHPYDLATLVFAMVTMTAVLP